MRTLIFIVLTAVLLVSCSKDEKSVKKTAKQIVEDFIDNGEFHYEMLSAGDRQDVSRKEWDEEVHLGKHYFPESKLTPASKYYELEQFLLEAFGYTVDINSKENDTTAYVTIKQPKLYAELSRFSTEALRSDGEAFDNALNIYKKGLLTKDKLNFHNIELEAWIIKENTVKVGAQEILNEVRKHKDRSDKLDRVEAKKLEIESFFGGLVYGDFITGGRTTSRNIKHLREIGAQKIQELFTEYKSLTSEYCRLFGEMIPEYSCFLHDVEKIHELTEIAKADEIIRSSIKINSSSIQKSRGDYGVFYEWEVKSLPANIEKYRLIMEASLLKGGKKVHVAYLGSQELSSGVKTRREGRKLDNSASLQRPDGVEITYAGISGLLQSDCNLVNEKIECEVEP
ncbi:hypothetical protein [Idiomarina sp.]|uniref:hypothetical protein n=1 Tax=Idiomarina sp. TaxID=1874361 RepID=UPI0025B8BE60|nr:hypothetical protein [Idiomarina sp.]